MPTRRPRERPSALIFQAMLIRVLVVVALASGGLAAASEPLSDPIAPALWESQSMLGGLGLACDASCDHCDGPSRDRLTFDALDPLGEQRPLCDKCRLGFRCFDCDFIPPRKWKLYQWCRPRQPELICETDQLLLDPWFYRPAWRVTGDLYSDFAQFCSPRSLALLGAGIGVHAILANTSLDEDFQNRLQRRVHGSSGLAFGRDLGDYWVVAPTVLGVWAIGEFLAQRPGEKQQLWGRVLQTYGSHTSRALIVGATATGILQGLIGSSRPSELRGSQWRPFEDDNGVSGHALIGAVPFLVAASYSDRFLVRSALVFASTLTGASRVYENKHFLSQALLGWWIAHLATQATVRTNQDSVQYRIVPFSRSGYAGFGIEFRR